MFTKVLVIMFEDAVGNVSLSHRSAIEKETSPFVDPVSFWIIQIEALQFEITWEYITGLRQPRRRR